MLIFDILQYQESSVPFLLNYSRSARSTTPALLVVNAPLEVVNFCSCHLFLLMGMFGRDPFYMKIKPSLDPVSSKTRVNLVFRHGRFLEDLLIDYVMRTVSLSCICQ